MQTLYSEKLGIVPCVMYALSENYITMNVNYVCACVFVVLLQEAQSETWESWTPMESARWK